MPTSTSLIAFSALAFALIVIPGPSVMFVVSRAVSHGRRAALVTVAGNALGFYAEVVLVALGLGAIVERSVVVFTLVKVIGAGYLIWLGIEAIRHRRDLSSALGSTTASRPTRSIFVDGFVVGIANPKTIIFFAAVLPQYVERGAAPAPVQIALLGLVFVLIALVSDSMWGIAAGTARGWLARSPRRLEVIGGAGGLAVIALGLRLAVSGRSD